VTTEEQTGASPPTAAKRYGTLEVERQPYIERAEENAKFTIPALMPPRGSNGSSKMYQPFQSVGARGVNNLASKLLLTLLPPNSPFFRLDIDEVALEEAKQNVQDPDERNDLLSEMQEALSKIEDRIMLEVESKQMRVATFELLKQLIVAGNALVHLKPDGGMQVFTLPQYVVNRDPEGNLLEAIIKEEISPQILPESIRQSAMQQMGSDGENPKQDDSVDLYTHIQRTVNDSGTEKWTVHQEVNGERVPESEGSYPVDRLPWLSLTWVRQNGEDYGRAFVEEYIGDLKSAEGLSKALVEGGALATRVVWMVRPGATTRPAAIEKAPNGAVIKGDGEDLSTLQTENAVDLRTARETLRDILESLSFSFLLNTSIQRSAERVTAEEIRFMAGELEDALGGVYSRLSQEFQFSLVKILMRQMSKANKLPDIPDSLVKPIITTGLEALGRTHDLRKLDVAITQLASVLPPEVLNDYVKWGEYIRRRFIAAGVDDVSGLLREDDEVEQLREQRQAQQSAAELTGKLGPAAIKAAQEQQDARGEELADQAQQRS